MACSYAGSAMPRSALSRKHKAACAMLYEAELEQCAARRRLQDERERTERAILSIFDTKACDLGAFHKAEASLQWWERVTAAITKIVDEQQRRDCQRRRSN